MFPSRGMHLTLPGIMPFHLWSSECYHSVVTAIILETGQCVLRMVLAGDSPVVCNLKCSQASWLALAQALELSVSGRVLTAADVPGTLPRMNCESYTAEDRCASSIFLNHSTETLHLLEENNIPFIKYSFIVKYAREILTSVPAMTK